MPKEQDKKVNLKLSSILNQAAILDETLADETIEEMPLQFLQVLADTKKIKLPPDYKNIDKVVINGMGGSNLGGHIVKALFADKLKHPILIEPGYEVPGYVDKRTLFILSSFSGNTEETLSVYKEVKKRGAKILGITAKGGGALEKLMKKNNIPGYIFEPKFDQTAQPRLGLGYSIFGLSALMSRAGVFDFDYQEEKIIAEKLEKWSRGLRPQVKTDKNLAKKMALEIYGRIPVLVAAEHLSGNMQTLRNQINETSKSFSSFLILPDLNHHALEGLKHPGHIQDNLVFVFFNSKHYHPRIQKRSRLTKEIVKKHKIKVIEYKFSEDSRVLEGLKLLQLGTWISFYMSILYKENPLTIPWVDWFKKKLG